MGKNKEKNREFEKYIGRGKNKLKSEGLNC